MRTCAEIAKNRGADRRSFVSNQIASKRHNFHRVFLAGKTRTFNRRLRG